MGWKKVKEHYNITHLIYVKDNILCVGSQFITDLIQVNCSTGKIESSDINFTSAKLTTLRDEIAADPLTFLMVYNTPDEFAENIPVYIYRNDRIEVEYCEKVGWPNCTHSGLLLYVNEFFTSKQDLISYKKDSINGRTRMLNEDVVTLRHKIEDAERTLEELSLKLVYLKQIEENELKLVD